MAPKKIYRELELTEPVDLCLPNGQLNRRAVGWSRKPLHNCNLSGSPLRKKRWNYWCVTTNDFLFSVTLSDIDYLGLAFVYFLDFKSLTFQELTVPRLFGKGCNLGNHVSDNVEFSDQKLNLIFQTTAGQTLIKVDCPDFGGAPLSADLAIEIPATHESLNVVIPWSNNRFQFTAKQNTLPAKGMVTVGDKCYNAEGGFACLDFGRGKWPFSSFWNWASASGTSNGCTIGLNFGAGWTDGTGMNENGVCLNGKLYKISEDLSFEYDKFNFMNQWRIRSTLSDTVDLYFEPFFERVAKTNVFILGSEVHQLIGRFFGLFKDEWGKCYSIDNLIGWAEDHQARW